MTTIGKNIVSLIIKKYIKKYSLNSVNCRMYSNVALQYNGEQDPAPIFINKNVQSILKKITRVDMNKVFQHKKLETKQLETPTYKFMTDEQLKKSFEEAAARANNILQMPPVVKMREPINCILFKDTALQGYDTFKYVFTDITYGVSNRDRVIVIRDLHGNLSKADWDVRHRMNQIYFPQMGRELNTPLMFTETYLKSLFERKEYEFILDRACIQFEPDDPEYQKVVSLTYLQVNEQNDFECLRSTRHFGPLTFFLVWFKMTDNLLLELISTCQISEANSLLNLYNLIHKHSFSMDIKLETDLDTKLIEKYITEISSIKGQLELALQSYQEIVNCNDSETHKFKSCNVE